MKNYGRFPSNTVLGAGTESAKSVRYVLDLSQIQNFNDFVTVLNTSFSRKVGCYWNGEFSRFDVESENWVFDFDVCLRKPPVQPYHLHIVGVRHLDYILGEKETYKYYTRPPNTSHPREREGREGFLEQLKEGWTLANDVYSALGDHQDVYSTLTWTHDAEGG